MVVCMICTGNTCRSPMAEAFLTRALKARGMYDISVCSAGIGAFSGAPASAEAIEAMAEYGIDLSGHRSRSAYGSPENALFLCMTRSHLDALKKAFPNANAYLFYEYAGLTGEVYDPYGMGVAAYRKLASQMERAAESIAERMENTDV